MEGKDYLDKLERSDDLKQIKIHLHSPEIVVFCCLFLMLDALFSLHCE